MVMYSRSLSNVAWLEPFCFIFYHSFHSHFTESEPWEWATRNCLSKGEGYFLTTLISNARIRKSCSGWHVDSRRKVCIGSNLHQSTELSCN